MKNTLAIFLFILFASAIQAQDTTIDKGSGWLYFTGVPGTTPSVTAGSEVAINTLTREAYIWNRDSSAWQPWLLIDSVTFALDTLRIYENGSATPFEVEIIGADSTVYATLYALADTAAAIRGDIPEPDGNGIIDSLPNGSITIDPNNNDLQIGTPAANNTGEFEFYAQTDTGGDVILYAGSADSTSAPIPAEAVLMAYELGGEIGGFAANNKYLSQVYNAAVFGDSVLISKYAGDTLALFISQLPITGTTNKQVMVIDETTQRVSMVDPATLGGGGSQTLSASNDSLTISGGNTVQLGINELLRDSVTTTTMTVDLESRYQKIVQIDMTSATNLTLTVNNPLDAGVYTFHFLGVSGTDNVTWPAAFYDANNTALGTDALTAGTMYTCYYSTADAKYFCK